MAYFFFFLQELTYSRGFLSHLRKTVIQEAPDLSNKRVNKTSLKDFGRSHQATMYFCSKYGMNIFTVVENLCYC